MSSGTTNEWRPRNGRPALEASSDGASDGEQPWQHGQGHSSRSHGTDPPSGQVSPSLCEPATDGAMDDRTRGRATLDPEKKSTSERSTECFRPGDTL
jgi:hypothetical protein